MSIRPRVALVTGASGDIGGAVVSRLVADGLTVWGVDLAESSARVEGQGGHYVQCNVLDRDAVEAAIDEIVSRTGSLDVLVNTASAPVAVGSFAKSEPESWEAALSSLSATLICSRVAIPWLREGQHPRIISVGSLSARGTRNMAVYSAAKAALDAFSAALALELGELGVTVNTVSPGPVDGARQSSRTPDQVAARLANIPAGRFAEPPEVASAVSFLASLDAGYVSGQSIVLSGGAQIAG